MCYNGASAGYPLKCEGTQRASLLHMEPNQWNSREGRWGQKNIKQKKRVCDLLKCCLYHYSVTLYYIYSMGIARHSEVKTYRKRLKHNKKENNLINEAVNIFREIRDKRHVRRKSSQLKNLSRNTSSVGDSSSLRNLSRKSSSVADSLIADLARRHSSRAGQSDLRRKQRSYVQ